MSDTPIFISDKKHGLPFSKGLMAQSFTATGLSPLRAYAAAQKVDDLIRASGKTTLPVSDLRALATSVLTESAGEDYARRYRRLRELGKIDKPLVILIGGTTGVGKSTIATEIAHRLGITRIISTDSIREVMRGIFSRDLMPAVYESSYDAWRALRVPVPQGADPVIVGFREQTAVVTTAIESLIERSIREGESVVIEGIHLVPGYLDPSIFVDAWVVPVIIAVDDDASHLSHFFIREAQTDGTRPLEKYRSNFANIRLLGRYIEELAREHEIRVIVSHQLDRTVAETLEHIVDAVIAEEGLRPARTSKQTPATAPDRKEGDAT
jgi:2-phosphoglycerate kinase